MDFFIDNDFLFKYAVLLVNFVFIGGLLLVKFMAKRKKGLGTDTELKKNVLFVIAHPDDESM